jgi:hypothetical protein
MKMTTRALVSGVALGGATLAFALGSIDRAQAATILLGNTGTGTYTLTTVPSGASTTVATVPNGAYPIGPWFDNTPTSSWIGLNTTESKGPLGNYTYSTTFNLTGLIASTAQISGNWAGDNSGVSILLNGSSTGITANEGSVNFSGFTGFSIANTANFQDGVNTLSFTINNAFDPLGDSPTGFRAEFDERLSTADAAPATAIPEPSDIMGTAIAFGSVVLLKRNLTKKKSISK